MAQVEWDEVELARLLRASGAELLRAEGMARNGLLLELHRLLDNSFRFQLQAHPDAAPEMAAQAFSLTDPLPAPQVVRELNRLGSPVTTQEVRNLYKHMNAVRNNMAHEPVLGRVVVSRANCKRMARLAMLVADALDPDGEGVPEEAELPATVSGGESGRWANWLWLSGGTVLGGLLGWAWFGLGNGVVVGGILVMAVVLGAIWGVRRQE